MIWRQILVALFLLILPATSATGHALEPGYLDMRQLTYDSWQVFWRKPDVNGSPMTISVDLPETCAPPSSSRPNFDGSAWILAWVVDCPAGLVGQAITIRGLEDQRIDVLLRLQALDKSPTTIRLTPTQPSYLVPINSTKLSVLTSYAQLGFEHILEGWDHLLFVFVLLILIRDIWRLVGAITAFTVAHSITLALAALGYISIPGPPVEAFIALSIVFLAVETLKRQNSQERLSERSPWLIAFVFGLLHGLGFAGALHEIGLPEGDIPVALVAFNLGVEAGQLVFVAAVLACGVLLRIALPRLIQHWRNPHSPANSALGYSIGAIATFWLAERLASF